MVTEDFIKGFRQLVKEYNSSASVGLLYTKWGRDIHFDKIKEGLEGLLVIMDRSPEIFSEVFSDQSLITFLSVSAIYLLSEDPSFASITHKFLVHYNANQNIVSSTILQGLPIHSSNENAPQVNLVQGLRKALQNAQKSQRNAEDAHQLEISVLTQERDELGIKSEEYIARITQLEIEKQALLATQAEIDQLKKAKTYITKLYNLVGIAPPVEESKKSGPKIEEPVMAENLSAAITPPSALLVEMPPSVASSPSCASEPQTSLDDPIETSPEAASFSEDSSSTCTSSTPPEAESQTLIAEINVKGIPIPPKLCSNLLGKRSTIPFDQSLFFKQLGTVLKGRKQFVDATGNADSPAKNEKKSPQTR